MLGLLRPAASRLAARALVVLVLVSGGPGLPDASAARVNLLTLREPEHKVSADYTLRVGGGPGGRVFFEARRTGRASLLLLGLTQGGTVRITVNGAPPVSVELLSLGGMRHARANAALVTAVLVAGRNHVKTTEAEGVQVVRVSGTNRWFATATQAAGHAVFSVNLPDLLWLMREYPVQVNYGPRWEGFLWFSGRWDKYYGEVYADRFSRVRGSSGRDSATLSFLLEDTQRQLAMPTQFTLIPEPATGAVTIRVHQSLRAVGETALGDGTEFLHVKLMQDGAKDWQDGTIDYSWYRSQTPDCDDAAPGSHTGMVRVDDNTSRTYAFRRSTSDPAKKMVSSLHHTGAAVALGATNTIGGYLSKTGVGSCGWVFHRYRANFRDHLSPVYGHCGDGADTHFFASAFELYHPMPMKAGDLLETEYSLTMLPCEVTREEIEDLNEADLHFFGTEKEQTAAVAGWLGTKGAVGLLRSDGSLTLLGLGRQASEVPLPASTQGNAVNAYRLFGLAEPAFEHLDVGRGTAEVRPGWITVVDCGAALWEPVPALGDLSYDPPNGVAGQGAEGGATAPLVRWLHSSAGVPPAGTLRRK